VAHSQDLASAVLLVGSLGVLLVSGASLVEFLAGFLKSGLSGGAWKSWLGPHQGAQPMLTQWNALLPALAQLLVPILAATLVVALTAHLLQTGFLFRPQRIAPDFSRTSPLAGLGRLFTMDSFGRLAFGLLKLGIIGGIAFGGLWGRRDELIALAALGPGQIATQAWEICWESVAQIAVALVALAVVDYLWQRWKLVRQLRMTPQDLREEARELDGNPQTRTRRRAVARTYSAVEPR
jgi:flagellar biosynthetic protein FlhB